MNMIDINSMLPDILGAKGIIAGVPPSIALDAVRKTIIDFCTQSTIWEFNGQFITQANVADYPIDVPEDARLASMRWVTMDGQSLGANPRIVPTSWMQARNPDSFLSTYGTGFTMEGRDFVWLDPTPQTDNNEIRFGCALKPTQAACRMPQFLYEDWNDAITSGTAYRLFLMPKQEWSNAALAVVNRKEYNMWIARARQTKAQNYTQSSMVMSGSYF